MTVDALIILAGALVALLPSLGFPESWDNILLLILGVCIVILGITVRRKNKADRPAKQHTLFEESAPRDVHHESAQ